MHALWASFVIEAAGRKVYCVGDTGFGDGATFARVRRRHPGLALALLPIGAYEPRWFMRAVHMNPAEAVQAHIDLGAPETIGMHFGTFQLTAEGIDDPIRDLEEARRANGIPASRFRVMDFGESMRVTVR